MVRALLWLHDKITDVGFQLGKLCLAIILFAYSFEVISRYFFSAPTWWADEAVSYSLCIGCFLMMPHVTREKGHVAVTFLIDLLPAKKAKVAYWFIYLMIIRSARNFKCGFIKCFVHFSIFYRIFMARL